MSFDLFLYPETFDAGAIRAWFAERPRYQVSGSQAFYTNEDTEVGFSFDFEDGADAQGPHLAFNLNYFRPHYFALEAEPEVAAFLQRFPSRIEDPQVEGLGEGPYSREAFLRSWNTGNRFGFTAIGRNSDPPPPWPADPALLEAIWQWNFNRARLQNAKGDNIFVPKVCWAQPSPGAAPAPCITWTHGVATVIPEKLITHLVLVRPKAPSLMKMLGLSKKSAGANFDLKLLGAEGGINLRGAERGEASGQPIITTPMKDTLETQSIFTGPWPEPTLVIVPQDQVCGADLVALMKKA